MGLIPLIQIIIDILHHLLITENKSGVTVTTVATPTTNTGQQLSVPSSSDENEGKDVCTASVTKITTDTTSTTTVMTSTIPTTVPASIKLTISPSTTTTTSTKTKEVIEELSLKNTLVTDKENKSKSVKNIEKQRVHDELNVNLNESKNYIPEILSTPANEDEEQQHQPVLPSTSVSFIHLKFVKFKINRLNKYNLRNQFDIYLSAAFSLSFIVL